MDKTATDFILARSTRFEQFTMEATAKQFFKQIISRKIQCNLPMDL